MEDEELMDEYFAAIPIGNATVLCVGGVTRKEAERARDAGADIDGTGYYLFLANAGDPRQPIQVLAKFLSELDAGRLAHTLAAHAGQDTLSADARIERLESLLRMVLQLADSGGHDGGSENCPVCHIANEIRRALGSEATRGRGGPSSGTIPVSLS